MQGVFFRDSVRREADRVGVAGWVLNRSDGAVEAAFEGEDAAVDGMVSYCRAGPGESVVDSLEVEDETPRREEGFSIRSG